MASSRFTHLPNADDYNAAIARGWDEAFASVSGEREVRTPVAESWNRAFEKAGIKVSAPTEAASPTRFSLIRTGRRGDPI